jgi:serine/threonine protein kinase
MPANVMVTKSGVKLLDFGLARVDRHDGSAEAADRSTTVGSDATGPGTLLGTMPYMAPEQLEGRTADGRTDIFALGVVLYEMTTGKRPFDGTSHASLAASIMSAEPPPMSASSAGVPPTFDRVVRKCLAKDSGCPPALVRRQATVRRCRRVDRDSMGGVGRSSRSP